MDFNGILYWITQFQAWVNAGGRFKFDGALATAIGGYPVGSVILLNDDVSEVICYLPGVTNDPNSNMSGWAPYAGTVAGNGTYCADLGSVNAVAVNPLPPPASMKDGYKVTFKCGFTNTGAAGVLISFGSLVGSWSLRRNDGALLVPGDLVAGTIYQAIYDAASTRFRVIDAVTSQVSGALFTIQNNVTASRTKGTTYTNNTGKPMFVSVYCTATGPGANMLGFVNGIATAGFGQTSAGGPVFVTMMVPPGATYKVVDSVYPCATNAWVETY
jgi:hypothetical protein